MVSIIASPGLCWGERNLQERILLSIDRMEIPLCCSKDAHFPASAVVRLPQVDDLAAGPVSLNAPLHLIDFQLPLRHSTRLQTEYLKNIASDLNFSKDVVKERGLRSLPFQEWDARLIYDGSDILPEIKKKGHVLKTSLKRDLTNHLPCHMKYAVPHAKPAPVRYPPCLGEGLFKAKVDERQTTGTPISPAPISAANEASSSGTFVTELPETVLTSSKNDTGRAGNTGTRQTPIQTYWEDDVLKKLTKTTAQWIVSQKPGRSVSQDPLCIRYGFNSSLDLVSDDVMAEADFVTFEDQEVTSIKRLPGHTKEKEPDIPLPVYYRVPSFCPQKTIGDEPGSQNRTGDLLPMMHFEPPPPVRLQDMMNPLAGKFVYSTENPFEHELYSGSGRVVHQKDEGRKDRIMMESLNEYNKHLQESFPKPSEQWSLKAADKVQKPERGALRWIALPSPVDTQAEMMPLDKGTTQKVEDEKDGSVPQERQLIRNMLNRWKEAWMLTARWHEATLGQLKRDLTGLHDDGKILAIATCASAAVERPQQGGNSNDLGISIYKETLPIPDVPEGLMPLLTEALTDGNPRVRMAAAVFHYAIQVGSEDARGTMQHVLHHGNDADSWAAAQCLALEGNATYPVVKRLLAQLFDVEDKDTEEQVCLLLTQLSDGTNLVHSLLADGLNSYNWRDRIVTCRALSRLHGHASQDVRNKLTHLMWKDWSSAVRQAAAQALGRMGLGRVVHNQLREKLERGDSRTRVEALCLIGWLRLMTAKLLPGFLQCFLDDFVAVRREACHTAGALQIKDEMVLQCLFKLMQSDPIWKIRVFAIRALGQIGQASAKLKQLLLWAVHYEEEPGVRLQACRSIVALQLRDPDVQVTLQDRLILEPHEMVRKEVSRALTALNILPDGNHKAMEKIQQKLHRLCQKDVVIPKLMKLDEIVENGRQKAQRLILASHENGFENLAALLGAAFSDDSRPSTMMTSTPEAELQALMDGPSRPDTRGAFTSQEPYSDNEPRNYGHKQQTPRGSRKPLRSLYHLRSKPEEQTTSLISWG